MKINDELLREGAYALRVNLDSSKINKFNTYLNLLKKWNDRINLTSIDEDNEVVIRHFLDSISISCFIEDGSKIIDIGSGAGFPGIPLSIINQGLRLFLVDSVEKKVFFLREVVRSLNLKNVNAIKARAGDDFNNVQRNSFDFAVSRAFGDLNKVIEVSIPYLKNSAKIVLMRGKEGSKEWEEFNNSRECKVVSLIEKSEFVLPFSNYKRVVLVLKYNN